MPPDDVKLTSLRDSVQIATSMLLSLTSGCYVAGLLIVNLRLAHFGVHSQQFNRTEYVLVGAVFALLVAGSHFALAWAFDWAKIGINNWKAQRRWYGASHIFPVFLAVWVPAYGLIVLSGETLHFGSWVVWFSVFMLAASGSLIRACAIHLRTLWASYSSNAVHAGVKQTAVQFFYGVISFVPLVGFYALFTYPHILTSYGGGLREPIVLVPTKRGAEVAALLHLPVKQTGEIGPVYLLTESEDEIVVTRDPSTGRTSPGAAVKLSRGLIDSVETTGETTDEASAGKAQESKPARIAPLAPATKDATQTAPPPNTKPGAGLENRGM